MNGSSTSSRERVALVTGVSSGIGKEIATCLTQRGYRVLGTCRAPDAVKPDDRLPNVTYLRLDITDEAQVQACARAAGPVDVLINNAGQSQLGPLEELDRDAMERLFAVNVIGPAQLTRLCLPGMRHRGGGSIVMIGSLMADFPVPFQSTYAATKLALRGLAQSLRLEVAPFGITVSVIQPGYFRSEIGERRERIVRTDSAYAEQLAAIGSVVDAAHATAGDPRDVAEKVWRVIEAPHPAPVYAVGSHGPALLLLKRLLPARQAERVLARRYGLSARP